MLLVWDLPKNLWPQAVAYATYIKNQTLTWAPQDSATPEELFSGNKPDLSKLREFGCKCFVLKEGDKGILDAKAEEHIFVGFADSYKAFLDYNGKLRRIMKCHTVIFGENVSTSIKIDDLDNLLLEGELEQPVEPSEC
jgi:hypothetical protein